MVLMGGIGWGDSVYGPNGCFAIGADSATNEAVIAVLHDNPDANQRTIGAEVQRLAPMTAVVGGRTIVYAPVSVAIEHAYAMAGNPPYSQDRPANVVVNDVKGYKPLAFSNADLVRVSVSPRSQLRFVHWIVNVIGSCVR